MTLQRNTRNECAAKGKMCQFWTNEGKRISTRTVSTLEMWKIQRIASPTCVFCIVNKIATIEIDFQFTEFGLYLRSGKKYQTFHRFRSRTGAHTHTQSLTSKGMRCSWRWQHFQFENNFWIFKCGARVNANRFSENRWAKKNGIDMNELFDTVVCAVGWRQIDCRLTVDTLSRRRRRRRRPCCKNSKQKREKARKCERENKMITLCNRLLISLFRFVQKVKEKKKNQNFSQTKNEVTLCRQ